jgi:tight adherence protein B
MLTWVRETLDGAGLSNFKTSTFVISLLASSSLLGFTANEVIRVPALSLALAIGFIGFVLEWLTSRSHARSRFIAEAWPEVIESVLSGATSGVSLSQSFEELADSGPMIISEKFESFRENLGFGMGFSQSLLRLKADISDINGDRLVELALLSSEVGGEGFIQALRRQSLLVREEVSLNGEIASRQGWITGTAKIAIFTPWLIVAMLATRPENSSAYESPEGTAILIVGLFVSLFAYRLVLRLGAAPSGYRVFA